MYPSELTKGEKNSTKGSPTPGSGADSDTGPGRFTSGEKSPPPAKEGPLRPWLPEPQGLDRGERPGRRLCSGPRGSPARSGRGREGGPAHINPLPQPSPESPPLRGGAVRGAKEGPCGALCLAAGSAHLPRALPLSFRARPALSPLSASLSPLTPAAGGTRPLRAAPWAQPETDREAAAPSAPHFPPAAAAILPPSARLPLTGLVTCGGGGGRHRPPP